MALKTLSIAVIFVLVGVVTTSKTVIVSTVVVILALLCLLHCQQNLDDDFVFFELLFSTNHELSHLVSKTVTGGLLTIIFGALCPSPSSFS